MIEPANIIETQPETAHIEERIFEASLRPRVLSDYIGQETVKNALRVIMGAAKQRGDQLEHILFYGPPGLGKTTLAYIIASEFGKTPKTTSGPAIERAGDLASLLTSLEEGDMLFIDEIHRLPKAVEEILYPALEDRVLDVMLGKGQGARSIRMELPRFTLIGATTQMSMIANPLRDRFGGTFRLEYYEPKELAAILNRSSTILGVTTSPEATELLAHRSRLTPRIANRLLRRVRDFAQVHQHATMTPETVEKALDLLEIDSLGLDKNDRRVLIAILEKFGGGPVGLSTIAAATGEEMTTVADVYEPFLIRAGLLARTPKGRVLTDAAYIHLGKTPPKLHTLL